MRTLILTILLLVFFPFPASATSLQEGQVGLYFDASGNQVGDVVVPFLSFDVYLVARIPAGGVLRYDLPQLEFSTSSVTVLQMSPAQLPAGSDYTAHSPIDLCPYADADSCPNVGGEVVVLARYTLMHFGVVDEICAEGFACDSFIGPVPITPSYVSCADPSTVVDFEVENLCLRTDLVVASVESSWGTLKGRFGRN